MVLVFFCCSSTITASSATDGLVHRTKWRQICQQICFVHFFSWFFFWFLENLSPEHDLDQKCVHSKSGRLFTSSQTGGRQKDSERRTLFTFGPNFVFDLVCFALERNCTHESRSPKRKCVSVLIVCLVLLSMRFWKRAFFSHGRTRHWLGALEKRQCFFFVWTQRTPHTPTSNQCSLIANRLTFILLSAPLTTPLSLPVWTLCRSSESRSSEHWIWHSSPSFSPSLSHLLLIDSAQTAINC